MNLFVEDLGTQIDRMKESFLWAASRSGRLEEVESLLSIGADPDWVSPQGNETALIAAVRNGHRRVVERLLEAGAATEGALDASRGDDAMAALFMPMDERENLVVKARPDRKLAPLIKPQPERHKKDTGVVKRSVADTPPKKMMLPDAMQSTLALREERRLREEERQQTANLVDELLRARTKLKTDQQKLDRCRGRRLKGMSLDELTALEQDLINAAAKVAKRRDRLKRATDAQRHLPNAFLCPIQKDIMTDPVTASDGHTYERSAITLWLQRHDSSPKTGLILDSKLLLPNFALKSAIDDFHTFWDDPSSDDDDDLDSDLDNDDSDDDDCISRHMAQTK